MKVLVLNSYSYYMYPDGITSLDRFADYVNKHINEFIKMTKLNTDNCCPPYFIKEDIKTVYINFSSNIRELDECEIKAIIPRKEYEERLKKAVAEKCVHCANYTEDDCNNLSGHWDQISLDGDCDEFIPIKK